AGARLSGAGPAGARPRVLPPGVDAALDPRAWEVPGVVPEIERRGEVDVAEMARVFNLGLGMVVAVPEGDAGRAVELLREEGHAAAVVGTLVAADGDGREVHLR